VIDYLRLALATAIVLAPGASIARALGQRTLAATLAWALAALFVAWAVVFTVHASIRLAAIMLLALWAAALGLRLRRLRRLATKRFRREPGSRGESGSRGFRALVWLGGIVLGWLLWHVEGPVTGDGPFHEARVRKLVAFGDLHLRTVDEFKDGGLHPGYAFPLWHGFLALVAWASQLDAGTVVRHEPSVLAPLACVLIWESGVALFGSSWAGLSVLIASLALFCFAPGHGGSFATLALPGTTARQLLVPAALVLFFAWIETRSSAALAGTAAVFGALALVHPTYALFLLLPLGGYAVLRPAEWRLSLSGLAAAVVPSGLTVLWLKPIADETLSRNPGVKQLAQNIAQYRSQLVVSNLHHFRLAPEVLGRSGAVAVAALALVPVTALAWRKRWGAFVLGGTLVVLALMEVPWLFVHFSSAVSLSQSRRAAGFWPLPFVFAGALALVARTWLVLPASLAAGIVLQRLWPGDFAYGLRHGGPAIVTWVALIGGAVALVAGLFIRPKEPRARFAVGAWAATLFALPVVVHGFAHWSPRTPVDRLALPPTLVHALRTKVPKGAIVIAPVQMSYRVVAEAPVYVVALPVAHVADTRANDPYTRRAAVQKWVRTNDPSIPRRYGATWAIRGGRLYRLGG
jgi:hypothetical protein